MTGSEGLQATHSHSHLPHGAQQMAKPYSITIDRVRELLRYNPETGIFLWNAKSSPKSPFLPGSQAGGISGRYVSIMIDGRRYAAHRLAWLLITGEWPKEEIDHKNRNTTDNRFSNLREATRANNARNQGAQANNSSGRKGIYPSRGRWCARIMVDGKRIFLGSFRDPDLAAAAYSEAARQYHGEFANHD